MAKAPQKVKWALGADEPEDLQEFLSNDDIVEKHGLPAKGTYSFAVKRMTVKPNKNGDDRISVMLVISEPKGSKAAKYNGYLVWDGLNVTEQSAPFIKRFLKGLGLSWDDFIGKTKQDHQEPPHIVQIAGVKFESGKDPIVRAAVKVKPADDYNDDEHLEIARYLPLHDEQPEVVEEDDEDDDEDVEGLEVEPDDEDDDEEYEDEDADDDDDEEDEEDDDEADEDDEEELREELAEMTLAQLRKRATKNDKKAKVEGKKRAALTDLIVKQELAPF